MYLKPSIKLLSFSLHQQKFFKSPEYFDTYSPVTSLQKPPGLWSPPDTIRPPTLLGIGVWVILPCRFISISLLVSGSSGVGNPVSPSSKIAPSNPQGLEYSLPWPVGLQASVFWSLGSGSPGAGTCSPALGWPPSLLSGGTSWHSVCIWKKQNWQNTSLSHLW